MQFELSEALIDNILFAMEDQNGEFFLDTRKGTLVTTGEFEDEDNEEACISPPEWEPSDGFRLMERFAAGLRNPLAREELTAALNRGKGVFRAFKDALSRYPETEKLWFNYKEKQMKREVLRWYNALRETWGLEQIGSEPEDTEDLVLEDFRFRAGTEEDREEAAELHRLCADEQDKTTDIFSGMNPWVFPGDIGLVAETAGGDFAGYISAAKEDSALHIRVFEVKPEYRGLGLAESMLNQLLEKAEQKGVSLTSIDIPAGSGGFSRALLRASFKPCVQRYYRNKEE
jgi:ribosomal protein S18 acetylase RimI-like enzyme